ncbi:MAG: response regulator [Gemmatimonadota bacterium]|nr:response regulator [Gemmatimonadota bacterium]
MTTRSRKAPDALALPPGHFHGRRILVIDDEETIRIAMSRFLKSRGFEVETAESGQHAIARLDTTKFDLLLCDVRMPGMAGVDLVPLALETDPDLAIVMLTAVNDAPTAAEVLASGAYDYLVKPVELGTIKEVVERCLLRREQTIEQRLTERRLRQDTAQAAKVAQLGQEELAARELIVTVAETLINAMEAKDIYLRGHSARVAELAATIANTLKLEDEEIEGVRMAGRLHDVGMIGIRESVLNKPDSLTAEEFDHVKDHVRIGMEILAPLKHLGVALRYIQDHHERWDGKGYPRGLRGVEISIGGRILAAADAFDSLTSQRAYRDATGPAESLELLATDVGHLLDEQVYDALRSVIRRRKTLVFIDDRGEQH